jgi:uncharacterized membrane protein
MIIMEELEVLDLLMQRGVVVEQEELVVMVQDQAQ